jgi:5-methylcytosine-specific restriction endonuclease McrA
VSKSGRRCDATAFIEFDHMVPHRLGGEGTVENIRLLCRAHNAFESERFYGRGQTKSSSSREEFAPS